MKACQFPYIFFIMSWIFLHDCYFIIAPIEKESATSTSQMMSLSSVGVNEGRSHIEERNERLCLCSLIANEPCLSTPLQDISGGWMIDQEVCSPVLLRLLKLEAENLHHHNAEKLEWVIADCYLLSSGKWGFVGKLLRLMSVSKFWTFHSLIIKRTYYIIRPLRGRKCLYWFLATTSTKTTGRHHHVHPLKSREFLQLRGTVFLKILAILGLH